MTRSRNVDATKQTLAAVIEHLPDGISSRAGLVAPQLARRVVREFSNGEDESVFDGMSDAIIVDLPFSNLIFESRVVQRLYYGLEDNNTPDYAREKTCENDIILLDPIRLVACLNEGLNSVGRQLLMRCFSQEIWVMFFKMVSLGIGEMVRKIYSFSVAAVVEDSLLKGIEDIQLSLVGVTSRITNCSPRGYTMDDIENKILGGCCDTLSKVQKLKQDCCTQVKYANLLETIATYLSHIIANLKSLIASEECSNSKQAGNMQVDVLQLREACKEVVAFSTKTASDLSVLKLQVLDERHTLFRKLESFEPLKAEVFRKGIESARFSQDEIVPLLILSHCMEAYGIREWCVRYIVERFKPQLTEVLDISTAHEPLYSRQNQSPFFRTAGAVVPAAEEFLFLLPPEILDYMFKLLHKMN